MSARSRTGARAQGQEGQGQTGRRNGEQEEASSKKKVKKDATEQ